MLHSGPDVQPQSRTQLLWHSPVAEPLQNEDAVLASIRQPRELHYFTHFVPDSPV